jgi:hypothetical protein
VEQASTDRCPGSGGRHYEALIARCLKFDGVVDYLHGAWFERARPETQGLQIDLMYIRKDSKIIVCEIKYNSDAPVNRRVIKDVQSSWIAFSSRISNINITRLKPP